MHQEPVFLKYIGQECTRLQVRKRSGGVGTPALMIPGPSPEQGPQVPRAHLRATVSMDSRHRNTRASFGGRRAEKLTGSSRPSTAKLSNSVWVAVHYVPIAKTRLFPPVFQRLGTTQEYTNTPTPPQGFHALAASLARSPAASLLPAQLGSLTATVSLGLLLQLGLETRRARA